MRIITRDLIKDITYSVCKRYIATLVQNDRKRCLAQFRTLKGTKRKSATSPAASTSKLPKVKREHDDPLGDEDFGDFIDEDDASDDDDGDDVSLINGIGHLFSGSRVVYDQ